MDSTNLTCDSSMANLNKSEILITPSSLKESGWKNIGGASWYSSDGKKGIVDYYGKWVKWVEGKEIQIQFMHEL